MQISPPIAERSFTTRKLHFSSFCFAPINGSMITTDEIDAAITEAEFIRSRHDGVHVIHSYVAALHLCRELAKHGKWGTYLDGLFADALAKARYVDRMGFAPKSSASLYTAGAAGKEFSAARLALSAPSRRSA